MARTKQPAARRSGPATDVLLGRYDLSEGDTVVGSFWVGAVRKWYMGVLRYNRDVSGPGGSGGP